MDISYIQFRQCNMENKANNLPRYTISKSNLKLGICEITTPSGKVDMTLETLILKVIYERCFYVYNPSKIQHWIGFAGKFKL